MFNIVKIFILNIMVGLCFLLPAANAQDIALPDPQKSGGMPLMEALNNRKSVRDFSTQEIPLQVLSDLLWAAYGYNRPQQRMRTAPSAWNIQNMDVYVAKADGLYLYDASSHSLKFILAGDIRAQTGTQSYAASVPVNLVYVADLAKMSSVNKGEFYSIAHAGFIGQNVYLFCASFGLATCVRDLIDRDNLRNTMNLSDNQEIILAQSIGYPRSSSQVFRKEGALESEDYSLSQNYPNPFNSETQINYTLSENAHVKINVFNLKGENIKTILNEQQSSGEYFFRWNGLNDNGERMTSGFYFYQIEVDNNNKPFKQIRRMLLLK